MVGLVSIGSFKLMTGSKGYTVERVRKERRLSFLEL